MTAADRLVANESAVGIGFDGRQVVVKSDDPSIRARVRLAFRAMLAPPGLPVIGGIEVSGGNGRFAIRGGDGPESIGDSLADILRHLRYRVTMLFLEARSDLFWLHAAAVARAERAVLIVGPGTHGKSTLAARLAKLGWLFLADDVTPLDLAARVVVPFPQTPAVRADPGPNLMDVAVRDLPKTDVILGLDRMGRVPVPVAMVVFPVYDRMATDAELRRCSSGQASLELLREALNFTAHGANAVQGVGALCREVSAYRLRYGDPGRAAKLIAETCVTTVGAGGVSD